MITIPDKVYKILKWVCIICLPACAFGYEQLAGIWDLPLADKVPPTLNLIGTILGIFIGVTTYNYNKENDIIVRKKVDVIENEVE